MSPFENATQSQKDNCFGLITGIFKLYAREGEKHYRITKMDKCVIVRESSQEPPLSSVREKFQTIMANLKEMGLFDYRSKDLRVGMANSTRFFSSPAMIVERINTELMNELLDIPAEEIPVQVPEHIQRHMSNFSPALQDYIQKCLRENLRAEFELNPASIILRSIAPSPIALTRHLEIPVRLPNAHLGTSNEHYDLAEILQLRQNQDGTRNNPTTRQPFNLNDIIPAPDILEQIKARMLIARNEISTERNYQPRV